MGQREKVMIKVRGQFLIFYNFIDPEISSGKQGNNMSEMVLGDPWIRATHLRQANPIYLTSEASSKGGL